MKKTSSVFFAAILATMIVAGCSGQKTSAPTASQPAANTVVSGNKIGVAECDEYIEKYQRCIGAKVPEAAQGTMKAAFDTAIVEWQKVAVTPEGKSGLSMACKAALDAAKQSTAAFGCEW